MSTISRIMGEYAILKVEGLPGLSLVLNQVAIGTFFPGDKGYDEMLRYAQHRYPEGFGTSEPEHKQQDERAI